MPPKGTAAAASDSTPYRQPPARAGPAALAPALTRKSPAGCRHRGLIPAACHLARSTRQRQHHYGGWCVRQESVPSRGGDGRVTELRLFCAAAAYVLLCSLHACRTCWTISVTRHLAHRDKSSSIGHSPEARLETSRIAGRRRPRPRLCGPRLSGRARKRRYGTRPRRVIVSHGVLEECLLLCAAVFAGSHMPMPGWVATCLPHPPLSCAHVCGVGCTVRYTEWWCVIGVAWGGLHSQQQEGADSSITSCH
jgi:hypothetical protein